MQIRKSILRDVMTKNGITVGKLCEKVYGAADDKEGLKKINETLQYREVSKSLAEKLVKAAGGSDEEAKKAALVMKEINGEKKKELDAEGVKMANEAAAKAWEDWDDNKMKPYVESVYAKADELLAADKAKEAEKAAAAEKKAATKKEAKVEKKAADKGDAAPVKGATDDPFAN
jgi:hypothetical protein